MTYDQLIDKFVQLRFRTKALCSNPLGVNFSLSRTEAQRGACRKLAEIKGWSSGGFIVNKNYCKFYWLYWPKLCEKIFSRYPSWNSWCKIFGQT